MTSDIRPVEKGWPVPGWVPAAKQKRKCGSGVRPVVEVTREPMGDVATLNGVAPTEPRRFPVDMNKGGKLKRSYFHALVSSAFGRVVR